MLLAGCSDNDGGGQAYYESTSSGGYAASPSYQQPTYSKADSSATYNTSGRSSQAPFGNYPVNPNGYVHTNCPDGSCNSAK